jgi:MFS family permease
MKISVEKALQVCGNNNRYQKLFYIAVALTWFSVDFVAICFPLIELSPGNFKCKDEKGNWGDCKSEEAMCKLPKEDYKLDKVLYETVIYQFSLYCDKLMVIMIGVSYTFGVVIGAFLSSKYSNVLGRKPVLLASHFIFAIGSVSATFAPNVYFLFGILLFIGIASAGGTMVSFLFIY